MKKEEGIIEGIIGIIFAVVLFSAFTNILADPSFSTSLNKVLVFILWASVFLMIIAVIIKIFEKIKETFY